MAAEGERKREEGNATKGIQVVNSYKFFAVATTLSTPRNKAHLRMAPKFMGS